MEYINFIDGTCHFRDVPVTVEETNTSYILRNKYNGNIIEGYIDYATLITNCQLIKLQQVNFPFDNIINMSLASSGNSFVPTICLLDSSQDNDCSLKTLTSLKRLSKWLHFVSCKCYGEDIQFEPEEKFPIYNLFKTLNVNFDRLSENDRDCIGETSTLFDFHTNIKNITWWNLVIHKHKFPLMKYSSWEDNFTNVHPIESFTKLNNLMRIMCAWESPYTNFHCVLSATVIFIYFLHDTNSSLNEYTSLLPILQLVAVSAFKTTTMSPFLGYSEQLLSFAEKKYRRALKSKCRTNHNLHLKVNQLSNKLIVSEICDLMEYILRNMSNLFSDCETFDHLLVYLRTIFSKREKPELIYYVTVYSFSLLTIRIGKIKSHVALESLELQRVRIKNEETIKIKIKDDVLILAEFVNPFLEYLTAISQSNPNFDKFTLNDEIIYYFMKSNNKFSYVVEYILKSVLPIVTSYVKDMSTESPSL